MKNALIITYYWPPSGGGGVQRWLKFTKYLPDEGWHCLVCTPENPSFDIKDPGLEEEIHPDTEVLKIPIWEPYELFKKLRGEASLEQGVTPQRAGAFSRFIRGNLFIPDPRKFWVRPAVKFLTHFLRDRKIDVIITTGPPHSMHLIGRKLKKKLGIPWVADFRDPWSRWDMLNDFSLSPLARWQHRRLEARVFREADGIVTVSREWAKEMASDHAREVKVITNGYDADDFKEKVLQGDEFCMVHAGLLNAFRFSNAFWHAVSDMFQTSEITGMILLKGMIDPEILRKIEGMSLHTVIESGSSVSHKEVIRLYQKCALLLLFMNRSSNASGHIPGKLFEYLASNRWIIGVGDPKGAAAQIIREAGCGEVFHWDDEKGIREGLKRFYLYYKKGVLPDSAVVKKFSRRQLSQTMAGFLDSLS